MSSTIKVKQDSEVSFEVVVHPMDKYTEKHMVEFVSTCVDSGNPHKTLDPRKTRIMLSQAEMLNMGHAFIELAHKG